MPQSKDIRLERAHRRSLELKFDGGFIFKTNFLIAQLFPIQNPRFYSFKELLQQDHDFFEIWAQKQQKSEIFDFGGEEVLKCENRMQKWIRNRISVLETNFETILVILLTETSSGFISGRNGIIRKNATILFLKIWKFSIFENSKISDFDFFDFLNIQKIRIFFLLFS